MADLTASADIGGRAIGLALAWSDPIAMARSLHVVRRRLGYPRSPDDGLSVLDLAALFPSPGASAPWAQVDTLRFLVLGSAAEGGLLQAEFARCFAGAGDALPTQVVVRMADAVSGAMRSTVISSISRVTTTTGSSAAFDLITTTEVYVRPGLGPEALAGTFVISAQPVGPGPVSTVTDYTQPAAGSDTPPLVTETPSAGAGVVAWNPAAGAPAGGSRPFVLQEEQRTVATVRALVPLDVSFDTVVASAPGDPIRRVVYGEAPDLDTGEIARSVAITDRDPAAARDAEPFASGLDDGVTYYYAAWEDPGTGFPSTPQWTALSVATGNQGFAARLFDLLPAAHRYYDDPASGPQPGRDVAGSWQLRRFLQVVGPALDQAQSLGEALHTLSDVFAARADVLARLGHAIGWEVDRTQPTQRQRTDILVAPEVFSTVGTVPNVEALVHRTTGWTCQVKEFVHNVFRTNFVEDIRLWEIWQAPAGTGPLTPPFAQTALTRSIDDSVDARPAVVADPGAGAPWLFWHSTRLDATKSPPSNRRQLWMQRLDGSTVPSPVMRGAPDDGPRLSYADEWPAAIADGGAIRLFWSSTRGGSAGIWTRTLQGGAAAGPPTQLTKHVAGDHCPAVTRDAAGTLWLFWHSSRRGPTDIWAMTLASGATAWSAPWRVAAGRPRDRMPSAFVDAANALRLTWSADLGDRSRILQSTLSGGTWSPPVSVSAAEGDHSPFRDEAPTVTRVGAVVWAFFGSDRDGISRIWASHALRSGWSAPTTVTTGRHAEKEPAAFLDAGGALRLFFRTQQSGEAFRSRTVDLSDVAAVRRGLSDDRWHYTYSVATDPASYYARDTVGLYITPGPTASLDEAERVRGLVEPFRPLPVRFVWFVQAPALVENVYAPVDIQDSYVDSADYLGPIREVVSVALPDWSIFFTNTPADVSANPADLTTLRHRVFYPAPT